MSPGLEKMLVFIKYGLNFTLAEDRKRGKSVVCNVQKMLQGSQTVAIQFNARIYFSAPGNVRIVYPQYKEPVKS